MADSTLRGSLELNNLDDYDAVKFEARKDPTYELLIPQVHGLDLNLVLRKEKVKNQISKLVRIIQKIIFEPQIIQLV